MEKLGRLKLNRFCGVVLYDVTYARITVSEDRQLCVFEIEQTVPAAGQDASDIEGNPSMQALFYGQNLSLDGLLGQEINIPNGYDEDLGDHVAHFQLPECEGLNNSLIQITENAPNRLRVKWTATTKDPNFYDGSKPAATIECETWMITDNPTTIAV